MDLNIRRADAVLQPEEQFDVAIVGAGPIGIELAIALKQRGVSYVQFDARQIGHTISWFAPQTRWFSSNERIAIAGVPLMTPDGGKATREQYLAYLRAVATQFQLAVRSFEPVEGLRVTGSGFELTSRKQGRTYLTGAKSVVLAIGGTERPRLLGIEGEDLPHVSAYFDDPHRYFGQRLLIVGGRNSAAEAALRCHHAGAMVTLSYRQATLPHKSIKYWLLPELQGLIDAGRIRAEFITTPVKITPSTVTLRKSSGEDVDIAADFVLKLIGYEADMTLFRNVGAEFQAGSLAPVFNVATMETTVRRLYVAGTAAGGTQQSYELFLENCHIHVDRILAHLEGRPRSVDAPIYARPET